MTDYKDMPIKFTLAMLDQKGKVLKEQDVHSFHRAFIFGLGVHMSGLTAANQDIFNTSGVNVTLRNQLDSFRALGIVNSNAYGIVVGLSNAAIDKTHHQLQSIIANGTGVNQLSYAAQVANHPIKTAGGATFDVTRQITNNSAADVQIEEVGLICRMKDDFSAWQECLMDRTLFSKTLVPTEAITLRYRFEAL